MAMSIIVETRPITGGVDTHLDTHVAAALDANGGVLGVESFATTTVGFAELHAWLSSFGNLDRVGVEGTGAYGAGLARFLRSAGAMVIEVGRGRLASSASVLDSGFSAVRGRCAFRFCAEPARGFHRPNWTRHVVAQPVQGDVARCVDGAGQAILDCLLESGTQEVYKWILCCRSYRTQP
jgi:Transposase